MKSSTNFLEKSAQKTKGRLFIGGILVLLSLFALSSIKVPPTSAEISGSLFKPGRIIDDAIFYNPNTMSASQIQSFLNAKVPSCDTNGTKAYGGTTRAAYGTSRGYPPPYICLRHYSQNIPTVVNGGSDLCKGSISGGLKSAAQIIWDVSQACSINPKVLIVLLEKEQSLVTDDWPWSIQYRSATGYGCPDTAPCDAEFYGFFNQVYQAAKAFQRYTANPTSYNYEAGKSNTILWHPNAACGTSNVNIINQATANLYIYTPYRPNQAALNNLYGTGDSCSSYGNRNFWRLFNDWFGNTLASAPYHYMITSQEAFSDASRTQKFTSSTTVVAGQKIYMRIKVRNSGTNTWDKTVVRLGTNKPKDRASIFYDSSWINSGRLSTFSEAAVAPGQTGTFDFILSAPNDKTGGFKEYLNLVAEGRTWFNETGLNTIINVVTPSPPIFTSNTSLESGEVLGTNQHLNSPDSYSTLRIENGDLVLRTNFVVTWRSNTAGSGAVKLLMQTDGNLVLYTVSNSPIWHTSTNGNNGARLTMQTDGNLVLYSNTNNSLWTSGTIHNPDLLSFVSPRMPTGTLFTGQRIETANRKFKLILQSDGNLVLRSPSRATWASQTSGSGAVKMSLQSDGNLVLYNSSGKPVWHTRTNGKGRSYLLLQSDGNLVLYKLGGVPTWSTGTSGKQ